MLDVTGVYALVLWKEVNPDFNSGSLDNQRFFLKKLGKLLVYEHMNKHPIARDLSEDLKMSISTAVSDRNKEPEAVPSSAEDILVQPPPSKRACSHCPRNKDKKTRKKCSSCGKAVCPDHAKILCITC